ncbi:MAG: hypothetical protein ABIS07_11125 [Dokdonella sp.]
MRTSLFSILCIAIRLGAVFLAFGMLVHVVALVLSWYQQVPGERVVSTLAVVIPTLLIAFLLWLYPGVLARAAAARSTEQIFETPLSASHVQWIAFSLLGMYFVMTGLIGLSWYALNHVLMSSFNDAAADEMLRRQMINDLLCWVVQIAAGLSLAMGAKGLVGLLHRLRYGNDEPLP